MRISSTAIISVLLFAGCSSIQQHLGFDDVSDQLTRRSGVTVHWSTGDEADQAIEKRVEALLSEPLTADSAIQIALLNNRGIQSVYQDLHIAQADLVDAGLLTNPILNGEFGFPKDGATFELSLIQDFIGILQIPLRKRIASARFEEAKLHVVGEVLKLSAKTKLAFLRYQSAEQRLKIVKSALDSLDASATLAKRLYEAGNMNELDLLQEQATYESLKLEIANREQEVIERREDLNNLLGIWKSPHSWVIEKKLSETLPLVQSIKHVEREVIANSTELAQRRKELLALASSLGLASQFSLFNNGEIGGTAEKDDGSSWGFGSGFSIPLPLFNQGQPDVLRAYAALRKGSEEYTDLAVHLRAAARTLAGQLRIARLQALYFKNTLLPLRGRVLKEYQKQYNGMLIGAFELLSAKREQIEAAERYIESLENYWVINTKLTFLIHGKYLEEN